jgi:hypothetical protein
MMPKDDKGPTLSADPNILTITNNHNFKTYPNQIELLVFYIFIQINYYNNTNNTDYYFKFLNKLDKTKFNDVISYYYTNIILTNIPITFTQMYQMSPYVTSVPILRKISSYKVLDLSKTILLQCCVNCIPENIDYICDVKLNFWRDDLVSHNYIQIKNLLKMQMTMYYKIMREAEDTLINFIINIKDPVTNKRIQINQYSTLNDQRIHKYIIQKQNYFRNKFFR